MTKLEAIKVILQRAAQICVGPHLSSLEDSPSQIYGHINRMWSFTVCCEACTFSFLQQGQSLQSTQTSRTFTWLCAALSLSSLPVQCVLSAPPLLLSDTTVYSGHVGWGVLFSRASCFAAAPKCLFLFEISRDLFGLRICGCVCVARAL